MSKDDSSIEVQADHEQPLAETKGAPETEKAKKRWPTVLWLLLLLPLAALSLLYSSVPERYIIPAVVERLTGYELIFERSGVNPVRLTRLQVRQPMSDHDTPPLLSIDSLEIHWTVPFPSATARPLQKIAARGIALKWQGDSTDNEATDKKATSALPDTSIPGFILPRKIHFEDLSLHTRRDGTAAHIQGLHGEVDISSLDDLSARVFGEAMQTRWQSPEQEESHSLPEGHGEVTLQWKDRALTAQASLQLPEFLEIESQARLTLDPIPALKVTMERCFAEGPLPGEFLAPFLPVPLAFTSLSAAPLSLEGLIVDGMPVLKAFDFDLNCIGLIAGSVEEAWYDGDVLLSASMKAEEEQTVAWTLLLNRAQKIEGTLQSTEGKLHIEAAGDAWKREAVLALFPAAYASYGAQLPLSELKTLVFDLDADAEGIAFDGKATAALSAPLSLTAQLEGNWQWRGAGDLNATATLGQASLSTRGAWTSEKGLSLQSQWKDCALSELLPLFMTPAEATALSGSLSGKLELTREPGKHFVAKAAATVEDLAHPSFPAGETIGKVDGQLSATLSEDFSSLRSMQGEIKSEDLFSLTLSQGQGDLAKGRLQAVLQGEADLMALGTVSGFPDLWGTGEFKATVSTSHWQNISISPCVLTLESLGYGDYSLPYGETLSLVSPARLSLAPWNAVLGPVEATLGEGTRFLSEEITLSTSGIAVPGTLSFTTDFAPVVAKQWLEEADGTLQVNATGLAVSKEGLEGDLSFSLSPSLLVLPKTLARLTGVSARGSLSLTPAFTGTADLALEEGVAAGIALSAEPSRLVFEEGVAKMDPLRLGLLGGSLNLSLAWDALAPDLPLTVSSTIDHIDLGVFTEEFKPESLVLTGIVRGEVSCVLTPKKLQDFTLMLESTENFSMNRDMVEQLLLNQYMDDVTGGRQVGRMLQSVLGKKAQTAFDRAHLTLGLEAERIAGTAKLESKSLNLTVDIKADPPALLEALRVRQEQHRD